uniref:acyltransferase family protein n=1 Tax=Eisenbergiella porci TaxID=2652274 RepID=UPI002A805D9E
MQKRIQYLDIIKVISIFLVVFCHFVLLSETVPANILMVACWSGVPMFFMVNGALLFTRPLKLEKHIRKTILIYIVLVAWRLIYLFTVGPLCQIPPLGFGRNQILTYLFTFGSLDGIGTGHLWFIEALLAVYLVFPLFRIAWDHQAGRKIILFFAAFGILMTNGLTGLQMLLDALCAKGLIGVYSLEGLEILNPFGTYANMLGFFLFGAWLHPAGTFKNSLAAQRLLGLLLSAAGLLGMWGVKWSTS